MVKFIGNQRNDKNIDIHKTNRVGENEWQTRQKQTESYMGRQHQAMENYSIKDCTNMAKDRGLWQTVSRQPLSRDVT